MKKFVYFCMIFFVFSEHFRVLIIDLD